MYRETGGAKSCSSCGSAGSKEGMNITESRPRKAMDSDTRERETSESATEWFLAELIEEFTSPSWERNLVHINHVLIQASSGSLALQKAASLGQELRGSFVNPKGETVSVRFRGVRELYPLGPILKDGDELFYEEYDGVPEATLSEWIVDPKDLRAMQMTGRRHPLERGPATWFTPSKQAGK
jgi:hypothetical protein